MSQGPKRHFTEEKNVKNSVSLVSKYMQMKTKGYDFKLSKRQRLKTIPKIARYTVN